jgi:peptidoglycan/LPS O-acetylase OafA/YrhL
MYVTLTCIGLFSLFFVLFRENDTREIAFMSVDYTSFLRGIAILMIILMHTSGNSGVRIFTPLGGIGVALFLILSGYGLTESYKKMNLQGFWKKKLLRIWLPYFLFLVVFTVVTSDCKRILSIDFLLDVLCLKTSFWFIGFLVWNYILFWIVFRFKILKTYHFVPFLLFAVYIFIFQKRIMAEQALSFYSGVCLSLYANEVKYLIENKKRLFNLSVFAILVISVLFLGIKQLPQIRQSEGENITFHTIYLIHKYGFALFLVLFGSYFTYGHKNLVYLININKERVIINKFLRFCSKISLELYLVHFALLFLLRNDNTLCFLIFIFSSFAGAYILYWVSNLMSKNVGRILK